MTTLLRWWVTAVDSLGIVLAIVSIIWIVLLAALCVSVLTESGRLLGKAIRRWRLHRIERAAYAERQRSVAPVLLSEWRKR